MSAVQTGTRGFASSPAAVSRALADTVSIYTNRLEENPDRPGHMLLSAALAPAPAERAAMEGRRQHLRDSLAGASTHAEADAMFRVVSALLGGFPVYGITEAQAVAQAKMVCRALDDVPLWAVQRAAGAFIKGQQSITWNPEKAPTAPQIRAEAMQATLGIRSEIARLSRVLDAELVDNATTEAERAAALAHWRQIRDQPTTGNAA